jgi:predicted Ser/Thr protein kinase
MTQLARKNWASARSYAEAIQAPALCFRDAQLRQTEPAFDRLGMPLVTSGQFAYVFKLKQLAPAPPLAVRCFRADAPDRELRYRHIAAHLARHSVPALGAFKYDADGILVAGQTFPTLVMEWIEGHTLDVYLEETIGNRAVLLHLADEWLRLLRALNKAGIAHGDLQHGNIIVQRGNLRLIDLDGMYVPALAGMSAGEVGHQHYQHPRRDETFFDSTLDRFSALVIYTSLVALAERPELWTEHHDENLIFTKEDFLAPESSALFAKIKEIGGEPARLAAMLAAAAVGEARDVAARARDVRAEDETARMDER